jgi:hypothetical protein
MLVRLFTIPLCVVTSRRVRKAHNHGYEANIDQTPKNQDVVPPSHFGGLPYSNYAMGDRILEWNYNDMQEI